MAVGRSNGPLPDGSTVSYPLPQKSVSSSTEETGPVIYYRNPRTDRRTTRSAPIKTYAGKDYVAGPSSENKNHPPPPPQTP